MKVVVDTNIVFSCVVRSDSAIGEVLLHDPGQLRFYAPSLLEEEFTRYRIKLKRLEAQRRTAGCCLVGDQGEHRVHQ
ncbi:MAG: hypothetical protein IPF41_11545 [Flavobacteriales bacterium]|nr:hypothetical protein [Flavobacteriales bacterium]